MTFFPSEALRYLILSSECHICHIFHYYLWTSHVCRVSHVCGVSICMYVIRFGYFFHVSLSRVREWAESGGESQTKDAVWHFFKKENSLKVNYRIQFHKTKQNPKISSVSWPFGSSVASLYLVASASSVCPPSESYPACHILLFWSVICGPWWRSRIHS